MKKIKYCPKCGEFTLKDACVCGTKTVIVAPPKYTQSVNDKIRFYKREARKALLKEKGLL